MLMCRQAIFIQKNDCDTSLIKSENSIFYKYLDKNFLLILRYNKRDIGTTIFQSQKPSHRLPQAPNS